MDITPDQLLVIIGSKEVQIFVLKQQLAKLEAELKQEREAKQAQ